MGTGLTKAQMAAVYKLTMEENACRAEALTSACDLQLALQGLLQAAMVDDPKIAKRFKDPGGPFTFAAQIKCAWAFGLIDGNLRKDLDCIREIRNQFAHDNEQRSFSTNPVRDWLQKLSVVRSGRIVLNDFSRSEYSQAVYDMKLTLMALMLQRLKGDGDIEQLRAELHEMIKDTVDTVVPLPADHEEGTGAA